MIILIEKIEKRIERSKIRLSRNCYIRGKCLKRKRKNRRDAIAGKGTGFAGGG